MPKGNIHLKDKYNKIRIRFKVLSDKGWKSEKVYEMLAKAFYMSEATIYDIVWKRGKYADEPKQKVVNKAQMTIFDVIGKQENDDENETTG
jgi:hypothetical protein